MKNTNKTNVKLTLDMLVNKKLQRESTEVKYRDIYSKKLDGELTFSIPNDDETMDYIDELGEDKTTRNVRNVYTKMIYACCELLHDKELHKEYKIIDPLDIIPIMFSNKDILAIGNIIIDATGFGEKEEKIKN